MNFSTRLDLDIVAVEAEDEVSVLLELTAPEADSAQTRAPAALEIVLDRSGSMSGDRLEAAKRAIEALIDRLDPTDSFGLVLFDEDVHVAVPAGRLTDKAAVRQLVRGISPGGMTNLSGASCADCRRCGECRLKARPPSCCSPTVMPITG